MVFAYTCLEINMAESVDELLRRRLSLIQDQGVDQSIFVKDQIARQEAEAAGQAQIKSDTQSALDSLRAQNRASELLAKTSPIFVESGGGGNTGGGANVPEASGTFARFLNAIQGKESGGKYSARNRDSGAMGKYQIMPGNIAGSGGWDKEALGRNVSVSEFMKSPQIQEAIARHKLKQYYDKYGAAGAAVAWYAGPGNARKYVASGGRGYNRRQGKYPSVNSYAQDILRRMGYK
jgi:hypothetical protein